jgi:hypothetical protein
MGLGSCVKLHTPGVGMRLGVARCASSVADQVRGGNVEVSAVLGWRRQQYRGGRDEDLSSPHLPAKGPGNINAQALHEHCHARQPSSVRLSDPRCRGWSSTACCVWVICTARSHCEVDQPPSYLEAAMATRLDSAVPGVT